MFEDVVSKVEADTENLVYKNALSSYDAYEKGEYESFSKKIKVIKVVSSGKKECILTYQEKNIISDVYVNKAADYFTCFLNKMIYIAGAELKNNDKIIWCVLICYDISEREKIVDFFANSNEAERKAYLKKIKKFPPEIQKDLLNKTMSLSALPEKGVDKTLAIYRSLEEMDALYNVYKPIMLPEYIAEYESSRREMERKQNNTERLTYMKVMRNILDIDWMKQTPQKIDVDKAIRLIKKEHTGHKAQIESIRTEMIASNIDGKAASTINLVGRNGGTSLGIAIAKALGRPYAEVDLSGNCVTESDKLLGSSRIYDNGMPGYFWKKLSEAGPYGVVIFKHIESYDKAVLDMLKPILSKEGFEDGFMELRMDLSNMWMICTSNSTKNLPISLRNCTNEIYLQDLDDNEILKIVNERFIPHFCDKYNINFTHKVSDEIGKILIYQMGKNDLHKLENVIKSIVMHAVSYGEKSFPKLTLSNIERYGYVNVSHSNVRKKYITETTAMEDKFFCCYQCYCEEVRKRELELLDIINYSADDSEKMYAISASRFLVNLLSEEPPAYIQGSIFRKIKETHYGHESYAGLLEDAVLSHQLSSGKSGMIVIGLHGGPGTGKTSSAENIAKALGRDFVKISLGGASDPRIFKGVNRTYANAEPGIVVRELSRTGSSLSSVILFDEPDKMEKSSAGNPYDPLHELLDPAQDCFYDEYLQCDIPKNNLVIILAFNDISKIPDTIIDRMKIIKCDSYSAYDKKTDYLELYST